jgi:phosphate transport system permease protein
MTRAMTRTGRRRWISRSVLAVMGFAVVLCLIPLASLLYTLASNGWRVINFRFLLGAWKPVGEEGGIFHAIVGSFALLAVACLFAVPIGLAKGMFLAQRGHTKLAQTTRLLLDVMSGIPAIIVGVFVYTVVVRNRGFSIGSLIPSLSGYSMLSGGLALAIIMLPIFARTTEEALRSVPKSVDEAGLALGLPRRRVAMRIILRAAMPAVLTGMFLAVARVAGEAAPLLFTAFGSNETPRNLKQAMHWPMQPVGSLPQLLFDYARQPFPELVQQAWGAALVLVVLILGTRLTTNGLARWRYGRGEH